MAHEYKVGDYVRICARVGFGGDYNFFYTDAMTEYVGKVFQIKTIGEGEDIQAHKRPDDGKVYRLEGSKFNWASSMFDYVPDEKAQKFHIGDKVIVLPRKDNPSLYTNSYVNSMLDYVGCEAVVTACIKKTISSCTDDGFSYRLDIDGGAWFWSSNALASVATKQSVAASENPTGTNKTAKPFASKSEITEEIKKVLEVRIEDDDQRYELNFNI